jgi:hypothetical protein
VHDSLDDWDSLDVYNDPDAVSLIFSDAYDGLESCDVLDCFDWSKVPVKSMLTVMSAIHLKFMMALMSVLCALAM